MHSTHSWRSDYAKRQSMCMHPNSYSRVIQNVPIDKPKSTVGWSPDKVECACACVERLALFRLSRQTRPACAAFFPLRHRQQQKNENEAGPNSRPLSARGGVSASKVVCFPERVQTKLVYDQPRSTSEARDWRRARVSRGCRRGDGKRGRRPPLDRRPFSKHLRHNALLFPQLLETRDWIGRVDTKKKTN